MPYIRPFRALRFDPATVGDLAAVVAPSCESIDDAAQERLLARHPANVVRVDRPERASGDEPDDRYRRAARTLADWRSNAILHKDPHPSVYLYEQVARDPATNDARCQRGYFARLRLEPLGPESGIVLQAQPRAIAKDERYKLLRATGVNTCPVVGVYEDPAGVVAGRIGQLIERPADVDVTADDGSRHRVWSVPADRGDDTADRVTALLAPAAAAPVTIVAGRDAYDAAIRYRDERRMSRSCEEDPPFDYVLTLFVERDGQTLDPTALTGLVINPHEW